MPSKKRQKEKDKEAREAGGIGSVLFGGLFSVVLGVVLGIFNLASIPVSEVREMPPEEEQKANTLYFVIGQERGGDSYRAKEAAFQQGTPGKIEFNEAELNSWSRNTFKFGAPKVGEAEQGGLVTLKPASPSFRIRDGVMNLSMPLEVEVFGKTKKVLVHSDGEFVNDGTNWAFQPTKVYLSSAPMPGSMISNLVYGQVMKIFETTEVYAPLYNSWVSLKDVKLDGSELELVR